MKLKFTINKFRMVIMKVKINITSQVNNKNPRVDYFVQYQNDLHHQEQASVPC
uniref:Uncharacterized protein n=1 Tax=Arundo donax TaxID=35708 RepID=A0A0A9BGK6_ARUDO